MNDKEFGLKIIKQYYDYMKSYYPFKFLISFDELIKILESRVGGKALISGLGLAANLTEMDTGDTSDAMKDLAKISNGKIPETNGAFYQALSGEATSFKFVDAVVFTTKGTAEELLEGSQAIGSSLILTGKIGTYLLPVICVVMAFVYLQKKSSRW